MKRFDLRLNAINDNKGYRIAAAVFAVAVAVRGCFLVQAVDVIDRLFVPDDTYYTLSIARSLARHGVPSASHDVSTSGFQPLFAFLLVPFYWVGCGLDTMLQVAVGLGALFGALNAALISIISRSLHAAKDWILSLSAGLTWAVSPVCVRIDLGGLETSLALFASFVAIIYWRFLRRERVITTYSWAVLGGLLGLMILARIDTCFFAIGIAILESRSGRWRLLSITIVAALLTVTPWWGYCWYEFGSPVPESGAAVRALTADHQSLHMSFSTQVAWAAGHLGPGIWFDSTELREWFLSRPSFAWFTLISTVGALAFASVKRRDEMSVLWLGGIALGSMYLVYLPALWFYQRYLFAVFAALFLAIISLVPPKWGRYGFFILGLSSVWALLHIQPTFGLHGAKGYRQPALQVWAQLEPDARVGALQSGALGYYAPQTAVVFNLDGVVDRRSAEAISNERLSDFVRKTKIEYFVDWPFNYGALRRFSSGTATLSLVPVGKMSPQGPDRFIISKVSP